MWLFRFKVLRRAVVYGVSQNTPLCQIYNTYMRTRIRIADTCIGYLVISIYICQIRFKLVQYNDDGRVSRNGANKISKRFV